MLSLFLLLGGGTCLPVNDGTAVCMCALHATSLAHAGAGRWGDGGGANAALARVLAARQGQGGRGFGGALVLKAAGPWSSASHELFPDTARAYAVQIMRIAPRISSAATRSTAMVTLGGSSEHSRGGTHGAIAAYGPRRTGALDSQRV